MCTLLLMQFLLTTQMHTQNQYSKKPARRFKMALRKSLKITMYQKALRKLLDKSIVDIIIFGSLSKGGIPKDVDIAVVVRDNTEVAAVKSRVREFVKNADIHIVNIDSIYSPL